MVSCPIKFPCKGYRVNITFERDILNDPLNNAFESGEIVLTNQPNYNLISNFFQKKDLQEDRRRVLSDEAKHLFRAEPGLLSAAENEFKSKPLYKISSSYFLVCVTTNYEHLLKIPLPFRFTTRSPSR